MHTERPHLTAMAGTALALGIMMTVAGSAARYRAQLSSQGSIITPDSRAESLLPTPMHGAAPLLESPGAPHPEYQLLLGMSLILLGFVLALALKSSEQRDERPVRIRVKTPEATMAPRRMSRRKKVYWMQVSL